MIQERTLNWEKKKLGEIVSFKTGKLNSNASKPNGAFPFFTCSQETFRTDTYSFDTECVLLGGNNANGVYPIKYFSGKFDAYQRTYIIRTLDNKILSNSYLFFALKLKLELLKSISTGVATKFLTLTILNDIEIDLPPLPTQRKIAFILSAYDDLIENNTRRIKILEEMAQALYREWFVKFRFPGHEKMRIVESQLGMVPEGWEVKRLDDVALFQNKGTAAGEHLSDRVYLPIDCIPRRSLAISEINSWREAQSSLHLFDEGDILFGAMRPYFHKVVVAPFKGVTRKTCFVFKSVLPEYHAFTALTFFQDSTVLFANAHSKGATIPYAVWPQSMDSMPIVVPSIGQAKRFEDAVGPMIARIGTMFFQNANLRRTRDLLLPKLISGEVDVEKIEIRMSDNGGA